MLEQSKHNLDTPIAQIVDYLKSAEQLKAPSIKHSHYKAAINSWEDLKTTLNNIPTDALTYGNTIEPLIDNIRSIYQFFITPLGYLSNISTIIALANLIDKQSKLVDKLNTIPRQESSTSKLQHHSFSTWSYKTNTPVPSDPNFEKTYTYDNTLNELQCLIDELNMSLKNHLTEQKLLLGLTKYLRTQKNAFLRNYIPITDIKKDALSILENIINLPITPEINLSVNNFDKSISPSYFQQLKHFLNPETWCQINKSKFDPNKLLQKQATNYLILNKLKNDLNQAANDFHSQIPNFYRLRI